MLRVTLKGVRGHVVRFLLTALAVTLGVAFVAGSFVLRDSMSNTLDDLLTAGTKGVDVVARGTHIRPGDDTPRVPLDASLAQKISAVNGVASARPNIQGDALLIGKDGHVVRNGGAPTFGFPYRTSDPSFRLVSGTGPTGPGEIAVEKATLEKSGLALGDTARVILGDQPRTVRITGVVEFSSLLGATAVLLDEETARTAFAADGKVSG